MANSANGFNTLYAQTTTVSVEGGNPSFEECFIADTNTSANPDWNVGDEIILTITCDNTANTEVRSYYNKTQRSCMFNTAVAEEGEWHVCASMERNEAANLVEVDPVGNPGVFTETIPAGKCAVNLFNRSNRAGGTPVTVSYQVGNGNPVNLYPGDVQDISLAAGPKGTTQPIIITGSSAADGNDIIIRCNWLA